MAAKKRVAILVRVSAEQYAEFEKWRKKMGQDKSGFAALCIEAGLRTVVRGVYPEQAIPPELMAQVAGAMLKEQVKSVLPKKKSTK